MKQEIGTAELAHVAELLQRRVSNDQSVAIDMSGREPRLLVPTGKRTRMIRICKSAPGANPVPRPRGFAAQVHRVLGNGEPMLETGRHFYVPGCDDLRGFFLEISKGARRIPQVA